MCGSGIVVGGAVARVKRGVVGMNLAQLFVRNPNIPIEQPHNGQNEAKTMSQSKLMYVPALVSILKEGLRLVGVGGLRITCKEVKFPNKSLVVA